MSMTKKDFEGIAAAFNEVLWMKESDPLTVTWCVLFVAEYCDKANPSFDWDRFKKAAFAGKETHVPLEER